MTVRVFVQNEAGSTQKHYHDEKTLAHVRTASVAHAYPYPYGFVVGTDAQDGGCVDCFIITRRTMRTGDLVECEPFALMEQLEDGVDDHNVLVRRPGEHIELTPAIEAALTTHVLACFQHIVGKQIAVGRFLSSTEAERHIKSYWAA